MTLKLTTISLTEKARDSFKELKDGYDLGSYNDAIYIIKDFFERNQVHPRDSINGSFFTRLIEMERNILKGQEAQQKWNMKDSQSLRKLIVSFENSYFSKITMTVLSIYEKLKNKDPEIQEIVTDNKTNIKVEKLKKQLDNTIMELHKKEEQLSSLHSKYTGVNSNNENLESHKTIVQNIRENYKLDTNAFGKSRVILTVKVDDFYKIFEILE